MMLKLQLLLFIFCLTCVLVPTSAVFASQTNGTISGYAWSSQIGWINFGVSGFAAAITDTALSGYAWNENTGRINLNPTQSGVVNNNEGTLSGRAWNEGTGWINFAGVTVGSTGIFSGTATGDNSVSINFSCTNCNVTTDWRPASARILNVSGGGSSGGSSSLYSGPFSISINNGDPYTNSRQVTLALVGGSNATTMVISNFADFTGAAQESFNALRSWTLAEGEGVKTVYAKFYNWQGLVSPPVQDSITLDTQLPFINITNFKSAYLEDEIIAIGGSAEPNTDIIISWVNQYGITQADSLGNWSANLGKLSPGAYVVSAYARDAAGNKSDTASANFSVNALAQGPETFIFPPLSLPPIIEKLVEKILPALPIVKKIELPKIIVSVPKITPKAFGGNFHYIPETPLEVFVLAPLPPNVRLFAKKFKDVERTFNEVGIQDFTDVQKLRAVSLKLPNLTESALSAPEIQARKLVLPKGISVADLSLGQKQKIPSEIVFAKTAGGLVDLNIALSLTAKGQTEQKITTVVGKDLELVVRADRPAKKVVGYVVFRSKKYHKPTFANPLERMAASLLSTVAQVKEVSVERGLVLESFEYQGQGNGLYSVTIQAPAVDGEYEIITVVEYENTAFPAKEIRLIAVVDPEGYIYEKNGLLETRVSGAVAAIYWLNPQTKKYELWPAEDFQQENPQTTDVRGTYSFLVPNGYYYLTVDAPGYKPYEGKAFEVKEGSGVHINIELKSKYGWLKFIDWKTALLALVVLLLLYNFYKDKIREKNYHS